MTQNPKLPRRPNPVTELIVTALTNRQAIRPMIGHGLREVAAIGLHALGREVMPHVQPSRRPDPDNDDDDESSD